MNAGWLRRITLDIISIDVESCIPRVWEVSTKVLGTHLQQGHDHPPLWAGRTPVMPGGVITHCTSLALPHQCCVLSSASQGMGSLPGEAQVEEGPRGESGSAWDIGCLGEASVTEEGSLRWEVSLEWWSRTHSTGESPGSLCPRF